MQGCPCQTSFPPQRNTLDTKKPSILTHATTLYIPGSTAKDLARCRPWWPPQAHRLQRQHDQWTKWRSFLALHVVSSSLLCSASGWSAWSGPEKNQKVHWWFTERTRLTPTFDLKIKNAFIDTYIMDGHQIKQSDWICILLVDESDHTFPDFHLISVDFEDGSPLSFKWNSLESTLFSKYGFSSKY